MAARLLAAFAVLALLPACSWWSGISYPIPPTTDGSDETPIAFEHYVQVSWDSSDLALLDSLDIQYPGLVALVPSADPAAGDELSVEIHFDVEKPNDSAYSQAFLQQIQAASSLDSQNAVVKVPVPQQPCIETHNAQGQITALQGVCVRELVVTVPASQAIPISVAPAGGFSASGVTVSSLSLALPAQGATQSDIENLMGNLTISGGNADSTLTVNQLGDPAQKTGNLILMLAAIRKAQLSQIGGSVSISITNPPTQSGAVTLDGTAITTFPYSRP